MSTLTSCDDAGREHDLSFLRRDDRDNRSEPKPKSNSRLNTEEQPLGNVSQKRRASTSPDRASLDDHGGPSAPAELSIRKRRAIQNGALSNPLEVLALAASSRLHVPTSASNRAAEKRAILLNSPFPSPLTQLNKFDLLAALMSHVDLLLNITSYLPPQTLLNLYSISAPFHYMMDSHFAAFIMQSTRSFAPNADRIFPWWCYRQLCIEDPALRRMRHPVDKRSLSWTDKKGKPHASIAKALQASREEDQHQQGARKASEEQSKPSAGIKAIPSFRWLKMVAYRESVSREIVGWLAVHGHRIPRDPGVESVKKMWFLMDMPVNAPRIALIHNTTYFTPDNLFLLQMFFIKLDMLYQDPIHYWGGEWSIREFLLAERSPTTLWNFLRGVDGTTRLDIMRLWIKHGYKRVQPQRPMTEDQQIEYDLKRTLPIMGVPPALVGRWGFECWGLGKNRLLRPDELVLREGVRRRLDLQRFYMRMIAAGYMDNRFQPLPAAEPDKVVLSLIRRRKNGESAEKETKVQSRNATEYEDGCEQGQKTWNEKGELPADSIDDVDELRRLVVQSLSGGN